MAANHQQICTLCSEEFTQPKILPCYHTFCQNCLEDHMKAHVHLNKFFCPVCRKDTEVPKDGASGFTANFYVVDKNDKQRCPLHKQMVLKFYCRDCSKPVCYDCNVVGHENHKKVDLEVVGVEARETLSTLKQTLTKLLQDIQVFCDTLTHQIKDIKYSGVKARTDVDIQVAKICTTAKQHGEKVKHDIKNREDEEIAKAMKLLDDMKHVQDQLRENVQCSDDLLKREATIPVIDALPAAQALTDEVKVKHLDFPEMRHPYFPKLKIDEQCLQQQIGQMKTISSKTFTSTFSAGLMDETDRSCDGGSVQIQGLPWNVRVQHNIAKSTLSMFLKLGNTGDENVKSCKVRYTFKLINTLDDSQSTVRTTDHTFTPDGGNWGWIDFKDWNFVQNKENYIVDVDDMFTVQTTVKVLNIEQ
ncbi:tripartite motif-containing protein 59-like [Patella vulgata]|uniref:tripartite motif-containing protein 59-like n=1 Tax=Patella vulgata TaxID=6465 RepID=UPI0024A99E1A|nr:tripartite motif-containing protein 59-like [Patella vulgata]